MQAAISREARLWEERVADGREVRVGLNSDKHTFQNDQELAVHQFDPDAVEAQVSRLSKHRASRDSARTAEALGAIADAARQDQNVMETLVDAAKAGATIGEISGVFANIFGDFSAPTGV
jgi:methylmalonyl-CoA mutase N-terminal domain/subunit